MDSVANTSEDKHSVGKTVYQCINEVQGSLAATGIGKASQNTHQHYNFRGIDDVYKAIAPLLARSGLVIVPKVLSREESQRMTSNNKVMIAVVVMVEYTFVGEDGSEVKSIMAGEATDTADKATNKAMSAAYKYLCLQTFCIPTEGDNDADATTHEFIIPDMTASADAIKEAITIDDTSGVVELWVELSRDEKAYIWNDKYLDQSQKDYITSAYKDAKS